MTKGFLKREFGRSDGNLYEGELVDVDGALDQNNGDRSAAGRDVAPLLAAMRSPAITNSLAELSQVLDVEQFARLMAVEVLMGHADGYCLCWSLMHRSQAAGREIWELEWRNGMLKPGRR